MPFSDNENQFGPSVHQLSHLEQYVTEAMDAVDLKLIRTRKDVDDASLVFHPEMAHQVFGETEKIFGYTKLNVRLYYTAGPLQIFFDVKYDTKIDTANGPHGLKADDIVKPVNEWLPNGCYFTNLDEYLNTLEKSAANFKPFGEKVDEFTVSGDNNQERTFEIYKVLTMTPEFQSYHARLQSFICWFIDAASCIDVDDPKWNYFVCYEMYKNSEGVKMYASVGYATLYNYYAYPEHIRPRISQFLVLPPFQKLGIAMKLLQNIYNTFMNDPKILDITVEDPSDDFQRIRSYVDAKLCKTLSSFSKDVIKEGFTQAMVEEARTKFKINAKQCRKVYEILRLHHTNRSNDDDYRGYRLEVKKRLNYPYKKQCEETEKKKKAGVESALLKSLITSVEQMSLLESEYRSLEKEYLRVLGRGLE